MSKYNIGDKVRFLNADGHGVIIKIVDENHVELENEYGFEEIFNVSELVPEGKREDYQTDNLSFDKQVHSKIKSDKSPKQEDELKRKFKHLEDYGMKDRDLIDLHIENLIDSHRGMNNSDILNVQMTFFRRFLNMSINKQHQKIVVIHGVGEGVLRHEIRKELDVYYVNLEYYDASYEEFGFGATEIRLRK